MKFYIQLLISLLSVVYFAIAFPILRPYIKLRYEKCTSIICMQGSDTKNAKIITSDIDTTTSTIARLKAEAAKLRAEALELESQQREEIAQKVSEIFYRFDLNNDGLISAEELRFGLEKEFREAITEQQVKDIMKAFDESGDGLLQLDEFKPMEEFRKKLEALVNEERIAAEKASKEAIIARDQAKKEMQIANLINNQPATLSDRFVSSLAYFVPLFDSLQYGSAFIHDNENPVIKAILILSNLYEKIPFTGLIAFLILNYIGNDLKMNRLIRFNIQQAILLDIALIAPTLFGNILLYGLNAFGMVLSTDTLQSSSGILFFLFSATLIYCVVSSIIFGKAPNSIPYISQQVEDRLNAITKMVEDEKNEN